MFWMNNKTIIEFGFRNLWRIMEISKVLSASADNTLLDLSSCGEQGWRIGESTRLPPMRPGFKSRCQRHMWVKFVVGSLPCSERVFSLGTPVSPLLKNLHFQIPIQPGIR